MPRTLAPVVEAAMYSLSNPANLVHGETVRPQQDEEGSFNQATYTSALSHSQNFQPGHDNIEETILDADMLVTDARLSPRGNTTAYRGDIYGNSFSVHSLAPSQASGHFPRSSLDSSDEDDKESTSDVEGGAPLKQVPFTSQAVVQPEVYIPGGDNENNYEEQSDDGDSAIDEANNVNAHQYPDDDVHISIHHLHPYLNLSSSPTSFPLPLHTLYGAGLMMDTGDLAAAWGQDLWITAGNDDLQEPPAETDTDTETNMLDSDDVIDALPPVQISNPNPTIPGSENLGLIDFLRNWAHQGGYTNTPRSRPPHLHQVLKQAGADVEEVNYADLQGDLCDYQALNWTAMEISRDAARARRCRTYKNYVNRAGSDLVTPQLEDAGLPSYESFFRFRRMNIRQDVHLAHFQLRSVLACPSRTSALYPSSMGVNRTNTVSRKTECVMGMRDYPAMGGALSALDAGCGVLMGGTFNGDYYLKPLDCNDKTKFFEGQITSDFSGITNHIKIYRPRRSSSPAAAIASNDCGFRVLDITTEQFISETMYPFALNCSALSPDRRLRVVVGDDSSVLITNADTGEVLQELAGHRDYGFACDWSEDGWTVATGFQDRDTKIWDARKWCNSSGISTPLCTIRSEMASVRGLRFSPMGSGHPVLVAAEETDYVNFIDAQTLSSKQTIDVFGEIGGVAFTNDGQDLNILCCDTHRGGLLQMERCGRRPEPVMDHLSLQDAPRFRYPADNDDDFFQHECDISRRRRRRRRRPFAPDCYLEPF